MEDDKRYSRQFLGKTVVSRTGKRFGEVGAILFETRSGELLHLALRNPTGFTEGLELERYEKGNPLIPFTSVIAVGDFVVVSEEDIL